MKRILSRQLLVPLTLLIVAIAVSIYGFTLMERIPFTDLSELNLAGSLLITQGVRGVAQVDVATGEVETLFEPAGQATVTWASLSPDGSLIALAFAPPPEDGLIQFGFTDLYIMLADGGAAPQLLLEAESKEIISNSVWSPDGTYIYYQRVKASESIIRKPRTFIERIAYPDGEPELLIDDAHSPAFAPGDSRMLYVGVDIDSGEDVLHYANLDGTDQTVLLEQSKFSIIDAPGFSPDGSTIVFSSSDSAVVGREVQQATRGMPAWFAASIGLRVALAHEDIVSDLWSLPSTGGEPNRLTRIGESSMIAVYSPDGQSIAFVTSSRLYLMNSDGSELSLLLHEGSFGSVEWVP